jgi:5-methylcytosine-specific restriction endonuclease McrA
MIEPSTQPGHESGEKRALPEPGSPELKELQLSEAHRLLYGFLYERRADPPTMVEIRAHVAETEGEAPAQTDRRVRDLRGHFIIPAVQTGSMHRYHLVGWRDGAEIGVRPSLSKRVRAQVLAPRRCAQCGRTPVDHGVVLVVDHMVPREWGGSDDLSNLQPLCEECNSGKRDFYATYNAYGDQIRAAANFDEPHRRIGELLKAFNGNWVPSDLIGTVASMGQHQEDWQKRLRELRILNWVIESRSESTASARRRLTYYRATSCPPWPQGDIRSAIKRLEKAKKRKTAVDL